VVEHLTRRLQLPLIGNVIDYIINISEFTMQDVPALKEKEPYVDNINNYRSAVNYEVYSILTFSWRTYWRRMPPHGKKVAKNIYDSSRIW